MVPQDGQCRKCYTLLVSLALCALTLAASNPACYFPNGTQAISNVDSMPYLPCTNRQQSMCCRTNSTDSCTSDGLCESRWDGNLWRDYCTDPTWQDPACVKLCLGKRNGVDGDGNAGGSVRVTQCLDGSYCCDVGTQANNCCSNGGGVWIAEDGHTTNVNPTATSERHTTAAATSSLSSSTSSATTKNPATTTATAASQTSSTAVTSSSSKSSSNTGAIAGGVVGGIVAIAAIVVAMLLFLRRRKNKRTMEEKNNQAFGSYVNTHDKPRMYGELDGNSRRMELPGSHGGQELSAEGYYNPKVQHPVHEMQS
ncbi:MAG: hypothetical protein Q9181_003748 [Wetmoreana brouardii]